MGRRARSFYSGVPTHLTAREVDDQPIFRSDLDRYELLALLRNATQRVDWQVVAWCLMTTHYHLLVVVPEELRVSWAMQTVNSVYAREFNARYRRRGHLFGTASPTPSSSRTRSVRRRSPTSSRTRSELEW